MKKKIAAVIAVLSMVMGLAVGTALAAEHVSISDIREEIRNGWHGTYEVNGYTVQVKVDIDIPDVDRVAAVLVSWPTEIMPVNIPENADVTLYEKEGFSYGVESQPEAIFGLGPGGSDRYIEKGAQAENSPLTADEFLSFAQSILRPYIEKTKADGYKLVYMDAWSRLYKITGSNSSGMTLDYNKPVTEMGHYTAKFHQIFEGIPLAQGTLPFINPLSGGNAIQHPLCDISLVGATENDYAFSFRPVVKKETLVDDLPLVSFSVVKQEFERLINAGYIREVYQVRLEYVCLDNPADLGNTFILMPVWKLSGVITEKPNEPLRIQSEDDIEKGKFFGGQEALVSAQTGMYYDPQNISPNRAHAKVVTWEQVK